MSTLTSVSGFPRIGGDRELKKAIEGYWKGKHGLDQVRATAKELRERHWRLQAEAGIDLIPSNDFSYYDQVRFRSATTVWPSRTPRTRCSRWPAAIRGPRAT